MTTIHFRIATTVDNKPYPLIVGGVPAFELPVLKNEYVDVSVSLDFQRRKYSTISQGRKLNKIENREIDRLARFWLDNPDVLEKCY